MRRDYAEYVKKFEECHKFGSISNLLAEELYNIVVTTYPSAGSRRRTWWCIFQGRKIYGVATNIYSRKTSRKPKMENVEGLRILKMKVWESFTHGEGISTPRAHHEGWQPLIECANHEFNIIYCPFYLLLSFSLFMFFTFLLLMFFPFFLFMFFTFFGVNRGVSLAPTYPRVRWGNHTYVVL